jgi:hypothetical protein
LSPQPSASFTQLAPMAAPSENQQPRSTATAASVYLINYTISQSHLRNSPPVVYGICLRIILFSGQDAAAEFEGLWGGIRRVHSRRSRDGSGNGSRGVPQQLVAEKLEHWNRRESEKKVVLHSADRVLLELPLEPLRAAVACRYLASSLHMLLSAICTRARAERARSRSSLK